ncbi:hypothetical protein [Nannocystis radixulma]|uniref:Uncharacterized protein n=1 Tax=Nannocystis radixulma TaxID=2995305 RepID=A0ABT5BP00_9BACT|nr:hypothetical protein [Nannocystis radixulma]MDC0675901.1 hypothetical protein [Nannocystis radixulma]
MKSTNFLMSTLLGGLVLFGTQSALAAEAKLPLVTFFSASRGDHFTTSDPLWTCTYFKNCPGGPSTPPPTAGYVAVGMQGHVWNPANAQPAGTVTLYHWWNPTRGDNFLTTDTAWAGSVNATKDGYTLFRIEGYIATSGTLALESYWHAGNADNAALATWRSTTPAGYSYYRYEGSLLPPDNYACSGTANFTDPSPWLARGNYIDSWAQPQDLVHGDRFKFTAPADWYTFDYWGHTHPVRGYSWQVAGAEYPAPGRPPLALLARVTTGRVFTAGGWYEANEWFQALGGQQDWDGPCVLYDATGVTPGDLQTGFNDTNIGDNSGGANVTIKQWW